MKKFKWQSAVREVFNSWEEFMITEVTDARDLAYFATTGKFGLDIRKGINERYGRGHCAKDEGGMIFISNLRVIAENPENSQRIKRFLTEAIERELIKKKCKG